MSIENNCGLARLTCNLFPVAADDDAAVAAAAAAAAVDVDAAADVASTCSNLFSDSLLRIYRFVREHSIHWEMPCGRNRRWMTRVSHSSQSTTLWQGGISACNLFMTQTCIMQILWWLSCGCTCVHLVVLEWINASVDNDSRKVYLTSHTCCCCSTFYVFFCSPPLSSSLKKLPPKIRFFEYHICSAWIVKENSSVLC